MQMYSLMQISMVLPGGFFSLELVQSLKKRSQAVPGVLHVGLALVAGPVPGERGLVRSARRHRPVAPLPESRAPQGAHAHSSPRPAPPSGSLRAPVRKRRLTPPSRAGTSGAQNGGRPLPAFS